MATNDAGPKRGDTSQSVGDELDSLNARTRRRGSQRLRRRMEATIEANAKKRRTREAPAASAWKR